MPTRVCWAGIQKILRLKYMRLPQSFEAGVNPFLGLKSSLANVVEPKGSRVVARKSYQMGGINGPPLPMPPRRGVVRGLEGFAGTAGAEGDAAVVSGSADSPSSRVALIESETRRVSGSMVSTITLTSSPVFTTSDVRRTFPLPSSEM
jgi:hypothetical protein